MHRTKGLLLPRAHEDPLSSLFEAWHDNYVTSQSG